MKKFAICLTIVMVILAAFTGCVYEGAKNPQGISVIYGITVIAASIIFACYCLLSKKIHFWYLLLFTAVLVVNIGYYCLSVSLNIQEALQSNRIAYLGSVFLPFSMYMITLDAAKIKIRKRYIALLLVVAAAVFLIAASPGYSSIYYKDVSLFFVKGATVLIKEYGPMHLLYYVYLLGYFICMVSTVIYALVKKLLDAAVEAIMILGSVFINIGLWGIEQFIKIEFELLAISYIISELFLLGLHIIINEYKRLKEMEKHNLTFGADALNIDTAQYEFFIEGIARLTATETKIFDLYTKGKNTSQILEELSIKENTLKFHNKNIYSKLGVSSRKELLESYKILKKASLL